MLLKLWLLCVRTKIVITSIGLFLSIFHCCFVKLPLEANADFLYARIVQDICCFLLNLVQDTFCLLLEQMQDTSCFLLELVQNSFCFMLTLVQNPFCYLLTLMHDISCFLEHGVFSGV